MISEQKNIALKKLEQAGDSFCYVISKLLRIQKEQQQMQQKESDDNTLVVEFFPVSLSELFKQDRKQLDDLVRLHDEQHKQSNKGVRR